MQENDAPHEISLAVWDLASPLPINRPSRIKIGARCSQGCALTGQGIEIRDESGVAAVRASLGSAPWPETSALYWTEAEFVVPATTGLHAWTVSFVAGDLEAPHTEGDVSFGFFAVPAPEHHLAICVVDKITQVPVAGVEVRLGPYRSSTDASGFARLDLPKGSYDLALWKLGYAAVSKSVVVTSDAIVDAEIELEPEPEQEYWMG